jgi:hypothetical protein
MLLLRTLVLHYNLKGCPTERAEIKPIYLIRVMPAEEEKAQTYS